MTETPIAYTSFVAMGFWYASVSQQSTSSDIVGQNGKQQHFLDIVLEYY